MRYLRFVLVLLTFPTFAFAGPFGLEMGMDRDDFRSTYEDGFHYYEIRSLPNPHPDFKKYGGRITPKNGLCYLYGLSEFIYDDDKISEIFKSVTIQLHSKYGEYTKNLDGPGFSWKFQIGSQKPHKVEEIRFKYVYSDNSVAVLIQYYFDNYAACKNELEDLKKQTL